MRKLKPCPFCGNRAELKIRRGDYGYTPDYYKVKCISCGAEISEVSGDYVDLTELVIGKWNTRVERIGMKEVTE